MLLTDLQHCPIADHPMFASDIFAPTLGYIPRQYPLTRVRRDLLCRRYVLYILVESLMHSSQTCDIVNEVNLSFSSHTGCVVQNGFN